MAASREFFSLTTTPTTDQISPENDDKHRLKFEQVEEGNTRNQHEGQRR
jgi:hypothetical protein